MLDETIDGFDGPMLKLLRPPPTEDGELLVFTLDSGFDARPWLLLLMLFCWGSLSNRDSELLFVSSSLEGIAGK